MKGIVVLFIIAAAIYGASKAYDLYRDNQRLTAELGNRNGELDKTRKTLDRTLEDAREQKRRDRERKLADLKDELERQRAKVADLDSKLGGIDTTKGMSASEQLRDELAYEREVVADLELALQQYRSGVAGGNQRLKQLKTEASQRKQGELRDLDRQLSRQQDLMKDLRTKLRDRRLLRLSVDQVLDVQNQYNAAQQEFVALQARRNELRAALGGAQADETQLSGVLARARGDQKTIEQRLAVERKRLKDLEDEQKREDKATNDAFRDRDKLANQLQTEKLKLQKLEERLQAMQAKQ